MAFFIIVCALFLVLNIALSTILILLEKHKLYIRKIAQKFGGDKIEKYQVFFDKEKLRDALNELKISGKTTDMFINAKNYYLLLSNNFVRLYYSLPPTLNAFMPYEEITLKNILFIIEKAAIQPKPHENILYFSKYEADG